MAFKICLKYKLKTGSWKLEVKGFIWRVLFLRIKHELLVLRMMQARALAEEYSHCRNFSRNNAVQEFNAILSNTIAYLLESFPILFYS